MADKDKTGKIEVVLMVPEDPPPNSQEQISINSAKPAVAEVAKPITSKPRIRK